MTNINDDSNYKTKVLVSNTLKYLLKNFRIYINTLLNNIPLYENVPHESYLSAFEIYHIPSSTISSIALNYVYWYKGIENNKRAHTYTNPNNIPINFFNSYDTTISNYKEEIFYAIAYIDLIVNNDNDSSNIFFKKLSLKLNKFDFFTKSKNYFFIKCFGEKDEEYDKYIEISKEYLKKENNDLFLKQLAFRLNFPAGDFQKSLNYCVERYNIFSDAISATKMFSTILDKKKNISYAIKLFNKFFIVDGKFNKNDVNSKYFKSFYVNKILTQLTTYYSVTQNKIKLNESIKLIEDLGFEYTPQHEQHRHKPILNGETIYLIKGEDRKRDAWYYVLVDPNLIEEFNMHLDDKIIHLKQYGVILDSAYGDEPPDNITDKIKKEYNIFPYIVSDLLMEKIT